MYAAGPHPRLVLPPRGPPQRGRHPHLPADRPAAAPVVRQGPAQRGPGRRDHPRARPAAPVRRGRDQRAPRCRPSSPACRSPARSGRPGSRTSTASGWPSRPSRSWPGPPSTWSWPAARCADGDVAIMMVEAEATAARASNLIAAGATAPTEEVVASGLEAAKPAIRELCRAQSELAEVAAKPVAEFPVFLDYQDDVYDGGRRRRSAPRSPRRSRSPARPTARRPSTGSRPRSPSSSAAQFEGREKELSAAFRSLTKSEVRNRVLREQVRIDGRGPRDIRPLTAEVGVLPRVHGSALFERGETQILGVTTLNMLRMEQTLDTLSPEKPKRYMHNYNFPPYSTGETGRVGSPKRREIGHGALAERALMPVLPSREEFPYAIRQVSEALGSNGSTSMGSVCASTLALLSRRCAAEGAGGRHRDGPHLRRGRRQDPVRDADRHPRCRGRVRRHGLQGRRHAGVRHRAAARHQARRHPVGRAGRRAAAGARGPADHPRRDAGGDRVAGRDVASTRRGSPPSRSRSTRSAW